MNPIFERTKERGVALTLLANLYLLFGPADWLWRKIMRKKVDQYFPAVQPDIDAGGDAIEPDPDIEQ